VKRVILFLLIIMTGLMYGSLTGQNKVIDPNTKVSLAFEDTPIPTVLKMLAIQNNLNLVVSSAITNTVSISLDNVSLQGALDAILLPNGYNYYISNGIIIVKLATQMMSGEQVAQTYHLSYITATEASEAIQPILSDKGKVVVMNPPATNVGAANNTTTSHQVPELIVVDYQSVHELIANFLTRIDKKRRQVSVEVKFIETNLSKSDKLGIDWPNSISATLDAGTSMEDTSSSSSSSTTSKMAMMPLETGNWQLGSLGISQLQVVLDFLKSRGNSKLLSNPRVTTLDNETATMDVTTIIPIQTVNRLSQSDLTQDIVTFQDKEVGISLRVTPRINDDSILTLQINPIVEEIIGYAGTSDNQKPITSHRAVTTNVTVKNGETVALGGLIRERDIHNEDKLFFFGYLPIIGRLFNHKTTEHQTTELLILITPKILD